MPTGASRALKISKPGAKSLFGLGVRCKPRSDATHNMIAAFDSMAGGTIFDASQASSDDWETSLIDVAFITSYEIV